MAHYHDYLLDPDRPRRLYLSRDNIVASLDNAFTEMELMPGLDFELAVVATYLQTTPDVIKKYTWYESTNFRTVLADWRAKRIQTLYAEGLEFIEMGHHLKMAPAVVTNFVRRYFKKGVPEMERKWGKARRLYQRRLANMSLEDCTDFLKERFKGKHYHWIEKDGKPQLWYGGIALITDIAPRPPKDPTKPQLTREGSLSSTLTEVLCRLLSIDSLRYINETLLEHFKDFPKVTYRVIETPSDGSTKFHFFTDTVSFIMPLENIYFWYLNAMIDSSREIGLYPAESLTKTGHWLSTLSPVLKEYVNNDFYCAIRLRFEGGDSIKVILLDDVSGAAAVIEEHSNKLTHSMFTTYTLLRCLATGASGDRLRFFSMVPCLLTPALLNNRPITFTLMVGFDRVAKVSLALE